MKYLKKKNVLTFLFVTFSICLILAYLSYFNRKELDFGNIEKNISVDENGYKYFSKTSAQTILEWIKENKIELAENDQIIPSPGNKIYSGTNIKIKRALKIKIKVDGETLNTYTFQKNILLAILENKIHLGKLDRIYPDENSQLKDDLLIMITRVNVEEKIISENIDFLTVYKKDNNLGWREEKIETSGEKGIQEVKYKITYENGEEISRIVLEKNVIKKPVAQVIIKGTYVKIGKAHTGWGTWYAYKDGLYAASPWLPLGSYARVTNQANGKSVIVQINDRGPFGKNRIIDLDKVAFQKISSLGTGVIDVKVEEILN